MIVAALNRLPGFRCATPGGAFYAFPNTSGTGMDSRTLQARLLDGHLDLTVYYEPAGKAAVGVNEEIAAAYLQSANALRQSGAHATARVRPAAAARAPVRAGVAICR